MLDPVANFISLTLSTGYDQNAVSVVVVSGGSTLPVSGSFNMTWYNSTDYPNPGDDPNVEVVRVNGAAISGNTLPLARAQEGTAASPKNISGKTYKLILGVTAKMITDIGNLVVGIRPATAYFTTIGGDTSFTITPPSNSVTAILGLDIGSQQFGSGDFSQSGNACVLRVAYNGPAGAPVRIFYTY